MDEYVVTIREAGDWCGSCGDWSDKCDDTCKVLQLLATISATDTGE